MNGNQYDCVISNTGDTGGSASSAFAKLKVYSAPKITPGITLSGSSIAANSAENITINITGLNIGDTVRIDRVLDFNGNNSPDIAEPIVQSFLITDGKVNSFGEVTDPNIPGDEDGVADGQITTHLSLTTSPEIGQTAGNYLIRVSSPSGKFRPVQTTLTVTQPVYGQSVSGQILTTGSAPVPNALVILLKKNGNGNYFASALADASGNYSLNAPVGSYMMLASQVGYVAPMLSSPSITLNAAQALTAQNLELTPATCAITGQLQDVSGTSSLKGVQLFFQSTNSNISLTTSDANGNFAVGTVPDQWNVSTSDASLTSLGYLSPKNFSPVTTTSGSMTTWNLKYPQVTALVYGTLKNNNSAPISGVFIYASTTDNAIGTSAKTDANGNYFLGVTGTSWQIAPDNQSPALVGYIPPNGQNVTPILNSATQLNFTAIQATSHLQGIVTNNGTPVSGVNIGVNSRSSNAWISTTTDSNGYFDLDVSAGTWSLQLSSDYANANNLVGPVIQKTITDGQTISGIAFHVESGTWTISGSVKDSNSNPITLTNVYASAIINGMNYNANASTDSSGNYSFPVISGTWNINVSQSGFTQQTVSVTGSTQVDFSMPPVIAHLTGTVTKSGTAVSGAALSAFLQGPNNGTSISAITGVDGSFDLGVTSNGTWNISLQNYYLNLNNLVGPNFSETIAGNQSLSGISIPIADATGTISGSVKDASSNPVIFTNVYASAIISGMNYNMNAQTDGNGNYSLPVISGTWNVGVNSPISFPQQTVTVAGSAQENFVPLTPFQLWQQSKFNAPQINDPNISGLTAKVPSGAGFPNLLAYALGLDPNTARIVDLPAANQAILSGTKYLTFNFSRNTSATDITLTVQSSTDLTDPNGWSTLCTFSGGIWTPASIVTETISTANTNNVQVQDSAPFNSTPKRFLRLKVGY